MKRLAFLFNFIITFGFLACNDVTKPNLSQIKNEQKFDSNTIKANNKMHSGITEAEKFDCKSLKDKKVILEFANSIIAKKDNKNIWNISEIDTNEFFTCEDYFTNSKKKNRLVLIGGNAGLSAGSEDNLLILFSCIDSLNILWSGQVGEFDL